MSTFKNPSAFSQAYPPASKFDPARDMPSLAGKVAVVTGGYSGIGYETVKQLLLKGATVYIFGRKQSLFDEAVGKLSSEGVSQKPKFIECDLASFASVKSAVAALEQQEPTGKLHLLFNNGGVMVPPQPAWTQEGHEMQFGTNVVGHWLLTRKLLPALEKAKEDGARSRVVFTSSSAADVFSPKGGVVYESLKKGPDGQNASKLSNWQLYGQSKIGDAIIANEFQRRYGDNVVFSSCNPGNLKTNLQRHVGAAGIFGKISGAVINAMVHEQPKGALTQLYAATSPETESMGGTFFVPWARVGRCTNEAAYDPEVGSKLWSWIEEETKGQF